MKSFKRTFVTGLVLVSVSACMMNQSHYEAGLKDTDKNLAISSSQGVRASTTGPQQGSDELEKSYDLANLRPGIRPSLNTDEAGIWMQMDREEGKSRNAGNIVTDKALNTYIQGLVCKLAGKFCGNTRVYVANVPEFNAFMAPNGMMQVWTGLLLRARNEAQLATVIGHEMGHFLRRHSLQRMRDTMRKANFVLFVQIASIAAGVSFAGDIAALIASGSIASFSRDNEREADGYGLRFLLQHGYDAREAAKIWAQLIKEIEADEDHARPSLFLASHPPSEERTDMLRRIADREMAKTKNADTGRERYLAVLPPIRAKLLRDELNQRRYAQTENLIDQLIVDGANIGELYFYKGELYRLRAESDDFDKAIKAYQTALTKKAWPREIYRSMGLVHLKQKAPKKAIGAFSQYLRINPNAEDKEIILQMMKAAK